MRIANPSEAAAGEPAFVPMMQASTEMMAAGALELHSTAARRPDPGEMTADDLEFAVPWPDAVGGLQTFLRRACSSSMAE